MQYTIEIGSPPEYEELVAYIIFNDIYIAMLLKEKGIDNLEVKFLDCQNSSNIPYSLFIEALSAAKKALNY